MVHVSKHALDSRVHSSMKSITWIPFIFVEYSNPIFHYEFLADVMVIFKAKLQLLCINVVQLGLERMIPDWMIYKLVQQIMKLDILTLTLGILTMQFLKHAYICGRCLTTNMFEGFKLPNFAAQIVNNEQCLY